MTTVSQHRQSDKDRLAAEIDHQVNSKAELEVGRRRRLDELETQMLRNHREHQAILRDVNHTHPPVAVENLEAAQ
jgi:uncharacterized membrane protein